MNNPIDPEELREAVIDGIIIWIEAKGRMDGSQFASYSELERAVERVRDHRSKASAPIVPERCEPPAEFKHLPFHWVDRPMCTINPWAIFWSTVGGCWQMDGRDWTDEETAKYEWKYVAPAVLNIAPDIRVEPTDSAIREFILGWVSPATNDASMQYVRAILSHFSPTVSPTPFQDRVQPWMLECFGAEISADKVERGDRLLEEVLELLQSGGYDPARVIALRDYVWARPVGEPSQEVGGVMVTLAAYCLASDLDMHAAGETELARISVPAIVAKIRAKQAAKPVGSALPQAFPAVTQTSITDEEIIADWRKYFGVRDDVDMGFTSAIIEFARTLLSQHSNPISDENPTIESVRELVEQMPRGTIWKTQLAELVEYTKAAVVRFGVGR